MATSTSLARSTALLALALSPLPSPAWALSCDEIMIMVDAKVPPMTVVSVLKRSNKPVSQSDVYCLVKKDVDPHIVAQAQAMVSLEVAEEEPEVVAKEKTPELPTDLDDAPDAPPQAKGDPERSEAQTDKDAAVEAGMMGAWDELGADEGAVGTGLDGVAGPIGLNMGVVGDQQGGYGFSDRGGGSVEGVGMGTHGRGTGRSGYGEGGGGTDGQRSGNISRVGGEAIIMGALDKSLIDKVIKQNQAKFLYCYQRELVNNPGLKGKVTIKFTISGDGSVAKAATAKSSLGNATAEACMNNVMKQLRFPEPKGGGIVIVKYPFVFSAG